MKRFAPFFLALLLPLGLFAQTKTTVADILYDPSGAALTNVTIVLVANQTFTGADGTVVVTGSRITLTPLNGQFSVDLIPNVNGTPAGTSYTANYLTDNKNFKEIWIVPQSSSPVNLLQVRALSSPTPAIVIPASQLLPPPGCAAPQVLRWTGTGWLCKSDNLGTVTINLENPTAADAGKFQWKPKNPLTLTRLSCSTDNGTATVNFDIRQESTPNTTGTQVLSSPLTCTTSTGSTTAIANSYVPSLSPVALLVITANGASVVRIHAEYLLN
jgi:hypothetical protein